MVHPMNTDIVEGAIDKSESGLRSILAAQTKLRVFIAVPVAIGETLLSQMSPGSIAGPSVAVTVCYCVYIVALHLLGRYRTSLPARDLLVATAVLDPMALSAGLFVTGEYGSLIVGFFLFTILGFGFRTGRPLMYLCQMTAITSFLLVFLSVPYWQQHSIIFVALMLPLMAVPMYAGELIKTLRASREHAERESQAKSELLAKVSHELRTPLTGIISATELLAQEAGYETVTRRTDTILNLSNELLVEINDLLDEAKFGARATRLQSAPIDLRQQVDLVFDALAPAATKKGVAFGIAFDPAIADWVEADAHHLGRVLLNLAGNAVKFTDRGHVQIAVDMLLDVGAAYRLRFSVADTGIGIPKSFHATIFQPFAQVEQGASRRYGGTGLGLTLSRQIVELMGGELQFESAPGQGSRFWFEVTLARSTMPASAPAAGDTSSAREAIAAKRILVAEDNVTNLLLLQELLQIDGHHVTTCASGMAALDILAEHDFDLLLLDYNLGDMDGVRLLQTYRFGRTNPAPTLFLTADTTQLTASRLREFAGGTGILYKPITLAKLRKAISAFGAPAGLESAAPESPLIAATTGRPTRPALTAVAVSPLEQSVIDELKSVSLRPQFFPTLLTEAKNDMQRCGQQILDALASGHHTAVRDAAHALKGVSANVGAVRLFALASNLMVASRDELDTARQRWSADLSDALSITVAALRKEVGEANAAPTGSGDGTASLHLDQ